MKPTFLVMVLLTALSLAPAARAAFGCVTNVAVTPTLRAEGSAEQVGDITLTCTGGTPVTSGTLIPTVNITLFFNAGVTTKLKTASPANSESIILVDEPNSGLPGAASVFQSCIGNCLTTGNGAGTTYTGAGRSNVFPNGVVSGNSVTFFGIPIDPAAGAAARIFRITGIRVNASSLPLSSAGTASVTASISISGGTAMPISNATPTVGFLQSGLSLSLRDGSNSSPLAGTGSITPGTGSTPSGTPSVVLRFTENFATVFKPRTTAAFTSTETSPTPAAQNVPGTIYNSESGLTFTGTNVVVAPADFGTRVKASFDHLPAGIRVWAAAINSGASTSKAARLISGETAAFAPAPPSTMVGTTAVVELTVTNGSAAAIWEVLATNPNATDTLDFAVWFTGSGSLSLTTIVGTLAPNPLNGAFTAAAAATASTTLPVPRFTGLTTSAPGRVISQMVDGGAWRTTVILVNTDAAAASFTLRFWDENGSALSLPLGPDGVQALMTGTIPGHGSRTIQTDGIANDLTVVWAEFVGPATVGGLAVFRQRVDGRPDQEAAVPLASPLSRFLVPFDNTQGFVTSLALVNTNTTQTASGSAAFRGEDGGAISQAPVSLSARAHTAFALPDSFPPIKNRRGIAEFNTTNPDLTALGLRFNPSGAFTSFPVLSFLDPTLGVASRNLSQVVDGGGWKTTFVLSNMDTVAAPFTLHFWKDDGTPLKLQFESAIGGAAETFVATLPVGGSLTLTSLGTGADLSQGWAELASTNRLGGLAVFRQAVQGRPDEEAAVPITTSVSSFVLPFDNTAGFVTSMAAVNTNAVQAISAAVVIRDETGSQIDTELLVIGPRGHAAFSIPDQFSATQNKRGTLEFSTTGADLSGLGLRFNSSGAFTSFPVLPK